MAQSSFHGFSDSAGRRIVVVEDRGRKLVVVEGKPYMLWTVDDVLAERMAVAQLPELGIGSQQEIAAAFHLSGKSVYRCRHIFAGGGFQESCRLSKFHHYADACRS